MKLRSGKIPGGPINSKRKLNDRSSESDSFDSENYELSNFSHFSVNETKRKLNNDQLSKFRKSYDHAGTIEVSQYLKKGETEELIYKKFENRGYEICLQQTEKKMV